MVTLFILFCLFIQCIVKTETNASDINIDSLTPWNTLTLQSTIPGWPATRDGQILPFQSSIYFFNQDDLYVSTNLTTWVKYNNHLTFLKESSSNLYYTRVGYGLLNINDSFILFVGGYNYQKYYNDVWKSTNGMNWTLVTQQAPFRARNKPLLVQYHGILYLMGGKSSIGYERDVWFSVDQGTTWSIKQQEAPWSHADQVFVFRDQIMVRYSDNLYVSNNGIDWTLKAEIKHSFINMIVVDDMLYGIGVVEGFNSYYRSDGWVWDGVNVTMDYSTTRKQYEAETVLRSLMPPAS